ncbi:MAG: antibiotic biosynthesis monooxygenase [Bacteroidota bacterium]
MIVRIVKMTFEPSNVEAFLELFNAYKEKIRASAGCSRLELLKDHAADNVYFTYSEWEDEASLNHYRYSALFKTVWTQTKALFADKAEAWSLDRVMVVG